MTQTYLQMLREAASDLHKQIALEAGLGRTVGTACAELSKIMDGQASVRAFRVIDAVYKFGNRELVRRWHEERFRHQNPAELLAEIGEQLDLLEHKFERVREQAKELAEVIPLRRQR